VTEIATMIVLGAVLARLGWKLTMIVGILAHGTRFLVFAFFPDSVPMILAVQLLHGVCYAFFFATVYIFVDEAFPKDVRSSAQGLFNLLILGVGMVVASFVFPALAARMSETIVAADGSARSVVDYRTLFLIPAGLAAVGVVILATLFRPPQARPRGAANADVDEISAAEPLAAPGAGPGGVA
jgi:hypothetical protein